MKDPVVPSPMAIERGLEMIEASGRPYAVVFEHGALEVGVYAPRGHDPQSPHNRDEAYVVVRGEGWFVNDGTRERFGPGSFLFVAAGTEHRFEDFTDDLVTWVMFFGTARGERSAG